MVTRGRRSQAKAGATVSPQKRKLITVAQRAKAGRKLSEAEISTFNLAMARRRTIIILDDDPTDPIRQFDTDPTDPVRVRRL